jgi:general secretion pathway protein A
VPVLEKSLAPVPQMPKVERELMVEPEAVAIKPTVDKPKYFEEKEQAITHLVAAISPTNRVINDGANILGADCDDLTVMGWRCEEVQAISWVSFKKINRPAIIRLTKEDEIYYAVVIGMTKTHAVVLSEQATVSVPLIVMGEYWTGEFTYLWQVPEDFERFIYKKSSPSLIQWLANAFATLDDRQSLLAEKKYNRLLEKRIKLFQRKYALKEDGKAGIETLLTLNERLGRAVTLNTLIVSTPLAIQ